MTLTLNLPPELEQYLAQQAKQQGISVETYIYFADFARIYSAKRETV
ncbi:MAG: hypothetical protein V7L14_30675 [Nostoc sp.]